MNPIRYAVVGLGRAGWDIHVHQLRGREDSRIVALVDPVEARRNEAAGEFGCRTYDSLAKMLRQDDVEVVIVATPASKSARREVRRSDAPSGKGTYAILDPASTSATRDRLNPISHVTGRAADDNCSA